MAHHTHHVPLCFPPLTNQFFPPNFALGCIVLYDGDVADFCPLALLSNAQKRLQGGRGVAERVPLGGRGRSVRS